MAYNTIQIKRRLAGNGALPGAPESLSGGELAFNEVDSVLYYGAQEGASIIPIGGEGHFATNTQVSTISADLQTQITNVLSNVDGVALNSLAEIVTAFQQADSDLNGTISTLAGNSSTNLASVSADLKGQIDSEANRATNAEAALTTTVQTVSSTLASSIEAESIRATAAEGVLTTDLASEVTRATAAEATLTQSIADEVSTRTSEITNLDTKVNTVSADLASNIAAVNTRVDNVLSNVDGVALNSLAEIVTAFQQADSDLNGAISTLAGNGSTNLASVSADLKGQIDSEANRATAAEAALTTTVQTVSSTLASSIEAESIRATAAEGVLTTDLASEVTRATNAEAALTTTVQTVSSTLASSIEAESIRATAAESDLDSRITSEVTTLNTTIQSVSGNLQTQIDNVLSNVDGVALNSLAEIVTAFQQADNDLNGAISTLASNGSTNLASVSADLKGQIDSEVTRATAAEGVLTADLTSEVTRATNAEAALDLRLDDIEGNYLDKRVGGTITGDLEVTGTITASSGLEINVGSSTSTLYVGNGVVGVNTETPSEALEVVGSGKFSGDVLGSGSSTLQGFVLDGGVF